MFVVGVEPVGAVAISAFVVDAGELEGEFDEEGEC